MRASSVIVSVLSLVVLIANGAVCILVCLNRNLRTYTNGFIVSLATSDILVGITLFMHYALDFEEPVTLNILYTTALVASVANVTAVTFDRHLACTQPFTYENIISRYFIKIVVFCWIAAVTTALLPLSWTNNETLAALALQIYQICILTLGIAAPYVWIFMCYVQIFRQVSKIVKRERKIAKSVGEPSLSWERGKKVCSEAKIAKIFCVIAAIFILSWLPIIWTTLVYAIGRPRLLPKAMYDISPFTLALGSIVNPILYSLKKSDFKHECKKMCCYISLPRITFNRDNLPTLHSNRTFTLATSITKYPSTVELQLVERRNSLQNNDNSTSDLFTQTKNNR